MLLSPTAMTAAGSAIMLGGLGLTTYLATAEDGYRFGFRDEEGNVPLFLDLRTLAAIGGFTWAAMGQSMASQEWGSLIGWTSLASLVATEAVKAGQTGELWGMEMPALPTWLGGEPEVAALIEEPVPLIEEAPAIPTPAEEAAAIAA